MKKILLVIWTTILLVVGTASPASARSQYTPWTTTGSCMDNPCPTHHDSIIVQVDDQFGVGMICNGTNANNGIWVHVYRDNGSVFWSVHLTNVSTFETEARSDRFDRAQITSVNFAASAGANQTCNWTLTGG